MNKILTFLAKLPSSNTRIALTLFCVLLTTFRYLFSPWVPNSNWLFFLTTMSGLDVTNHYLRRKTQFVPKKQ